MKKGARAHPKALRPEPDVPSAASEFRHPSTLLVLQTSSAQAASLSPRSWALSLGPAPGRTWEAHMRMVIQKSLSAPRDRASGASK